MPRMADMSLVRMLDDVNTTLLEQYVASDKPGAVAGYVNGKYDNYATLAAKYAPAGLHLISIDVANKPAAGAQCLDIESGDATVADAPAWFKATQAAGKAANDLRYYPKLYTSESNLASLVATMTKEGVARDEYMLWSAHYTNSAHICGPKTCGSSVQADATQWTSSYKGVSLDASECYGYFFAGPPAKTVAPAPAATIAPKEYTVPSVTGKTVAQALQIIHDAGFCCHLNGHTGTIVSATPAGGTKTTVNHIDIKSNDGAY